MSGESSDRSSMCDIARLLITFCTDYPQNIENTNIYICILYRHLSTLCVCVCVCVWCVCVCVCACVEGCMCMEGCMCVEWCMCVCACTCTCHVWVSKGSRREGDKRQSGWQAEKHGRKIVCFFNDWKYTQIPYCYMLWKPTKTVTHRYQDPFYFSTVSSTELDSSLVKLTGLPK